jgi:hypothetical protein
MLQRLILMLTGTGILALAQTAANMQSVPNSFWRLSDTVGDRPSSHYLFLQQREVSKLTRVCDAAGD